MSSKVDKEDQYVLYESVKKTCRALLQSAKHGLTTHNLARDYESIIGEVLPYKLLGYNSMLALIESMPDAVCVYKQGNGTMILTAVANASCKHISDLVSKQRTSRPSGGYHKSSSSLRGSNIFRPLPSPYTRGQAHIPNTFPIKLRQLMLAYADGLPVDRFQEAFWRRFGYYPNPDAWGFKSITDVLRGLADVVEIKQEGGRECVYSANRNNKS